MLRLFPGRTQRHAFRGGQRVQHRQHAVDHRSERDVDEREREDPRLGDSLRRSIKTGYQCRYEPAEGAPERWDIRTS